MLKQFRIQDIGDLDEGADAMRINKLIERAAVDCINRAGVTNPRKVTVDILIVPVAGDSGICDQVAIELRVSASIPKSIGKTYHMGADPMGRLKHNAASPHDPKQMTIDEATGEVIDTRVR